MKQPSSSLIERAGTAAIGAIVGFVLGLALQLIWIAATTSSTISAKFVWICCLAGAAVGAVSSAAALHAASGLLSFLWGFVQGLRARWVSDEDDEANWPRWIAVLVGLGFAVGVAMLVWLYL